MGFNQIISVDIKVPNRLVGLGRSILFFVGVVGMDQFCYSDWTAR